MLGSSVTVMGVGAIPEAGVTVSQFAEDAEVETVNARPGDPVWRV